MNPLPLITVTPRLPNERLWFLVGKQADGSISPTETLELDVMVRALETEQDLRSEGC